MALSAHRILAIEPQLPGQCAPACSPSTTVATHPPRISSLSGPKYQTELSTFAQSPTRIPIPGNAVSRNWEVYDPNANGTNNGNKPSMIWQPNEYWQIFNIETFVPEATSAP